MAIRQSQSARTLGMLCAGILICLHCGCNQGARSLSFDAELARKSLVIFLDAWKQGARPAALKAGSPSIIAGDYAWEAGAKLLSYEIAPTETNDGTNLHATVKLVLDGPQSGDAQGDVVYIVGTSPVITIFRQ